MRIDWVVSRPPVSSSDAAGLCSDTCDAIGGSVRGDSRGDCWLIGSGSIVELDPVVGNVSGSVRDRSKGRTTWSEYRPFGGGEFGKGIAAGDNG